MKELEIFIAEMNAEGILAESVKTAKKVRLVNISSNAFYPGQDMRWTEKMESPVRTENEIVVYHYSDSRIKAFSPKETCFFTELRLINGFVYQVIVPAGSTVIYSTTGEEVRVDLEQNNIKISEIAEIFNKKVKIYK